MCLLIINKITYFCKKWIETCSDIDLKMSCIESNEYELQDLSNQHHDIKKALEEFTNKEVPILYILI